MPIERRSTPEEQRERAREETERSGERWRERRAAAACSAEWGFQPEMYSSLNWVQPQMCALVTTRAFLFRPFVSPICQFAFSVWQFAGKDVKLNQIKQWNANGADSSLIRQGVLWSIKITSKTPLIWYPMNGIFIPRQKEIFALMVIRTWIQVLWCLSHFAPLPACVHLWLQQLSAIWCSLLHIPRECVRQRAEYTHSPPRFIVRPVWSPHC